MCSTMGQEERAYRGQFKGCPGQVFFTADVDLAAYLWARAYPVVDLRFPSYGCALGFPAEAASSAEAFYAGASVRAKDLFHAARELKAILERREVNHEFQRNNTFSE